MNYIETVEEREELCSIVSKIVSFKLIRRTIDSNPSGGGEIIGFNCASSSPSCESRCTYKMLLDND